MSTGRDAHASTAGVTSSPGFPDLTHRERTIIIIGLMTGLLLAALDQTIVATALPTIVGELGGIDHLSWVVTAYLLASTALGFAYAVWLEASRGQTVGKMAVGLKAIGPDGRVPTNDVALKRNAWLLLALVPIVGPLLSFVAAVAIGVTMVNDPFKRGTHDNFAGGSAVVRAR